MIHWDWGWEQDRRKGQIHYYGESESERVGNYDQIAIPHIEGISSHQRGKDKERWGEKKKLIMLSRRIVHEGDVLFDQNGKESIWNFDLKYFVSLRKKLTDCLCWNYINHNFKPSQIKLDDKIIVCSLNFILRNVQWSKGMYANDWRPPII